MTDRARRAVHRRAGLAQAQCDKNYAFGVLKAFVLCRFAGGTFEHNSETTETALFDRASVPQNLAVEKTTKEQILMCFDAYEDPHMQTQFD